MKNQKNTPVHSGVPGEQSDKKMLILECGDEDVGPDAYDMMADWIADAEALGIESEHVWDASIENPPHPY